MHRRTVPAGQRVGQGTTDGGNRRGATAGAPFAADRVLQSQEREVLVRQIPEVRDPGNPMPACQSAPHIVRQPRPAGRPDSVIVFLAGQSLGGFEHVFRESERRPVGEQDIQRQVKPSHRFRGGPGRVRNGARPGRHPAGRPTGDRSVHPPPASNRRTRPWASSRTAEGTWPSWPDGGRRTTRTDNRLGSPIARVCPHHTLPPTDPVVVPLSDRRPDRLHLIPFRAACGKAPSGTDKGPPAERRRPDGGRRARGRHRE